MKKRPIVIGDTGGNASMKISESDYGTLINHALRPASHGKGLVLDLFAGCGGLGLGFEAAGFDTIGFEQDSDCCATYKANLNGDCHEVRLTPDFVFPQADIVIGGPPCQPFSVGGHQLGLEDSRDGFPVFVAAVEQLKPRLWLFENVRGLLYRNRWYLDQILTRLERAGYIVDYHLLNAVHYLVPQNRERIIVTGHLGGFSFPEKAKHLVPAGIALGDMAHAAPGDAKYLTPSMDEYVAKYERASKCINPRDLNLDKPARTLTCRNLAGATGDMQRIKLPDGRRRRLTPQQAARLQSFPDWFAFHGTETSQFNQIGNAVPPMFAKALADSVADYVNNGKHYSDAEICSKWSPKQAALEFSTT